MKVCKSPLLTGHVERGDNVEPDSSCARSRANTLLGMEKKSFCAKRC